MEASFTHYKLLSCRHLSLQRNALMKSLRRPEIKSTLLGPAAKQTLICTQGLSNKIPTRFFSYRYNENVQTYNKVKRILQWTPIMPNTSMLSWPSPRQAYRWGRWNWSSLKETGEGRWCHLPLSTVYCQLIPERAGSPPPVPGPKHWQHNESGSFHWQPAPESAQ